MRTTRKEKINFLKGLLTGDRKLSELSHNRNTLKRFFEIDTQPGVFKDGDTGEILSNERIIELRERKENILVYRIKTTQEESEKNMETIARLFTD